MEIDRTDILRAAITNQAYREGNTLFAAGMVGTPEVKSFWKDEMTVEGPVEAADGTFISRVDLAAGHIHRGSCSCGEKGGLCAHQVALLLKYKQMALQEQSRQMPVHTTFQAHQLLLHFSDASLQERRQKKEGGGALVRLIPCLSFGEEGAYLTLRIGREKPYLVKNIWEMVSHFRERETAFYGKNLEFLHVPEMLEDFSRRLLRFIEKECMYYVEIHQGKEGSSGIRFRSLFLLPAALDEFFELYQDRKLDVEDLHGQPSVVMVENNVPSFSLQISPVGRDGIRLFAPEPFYYMEGLEGGYLFQGKKIYRCSEECFKNMAPLWKALSNR